MPKRHLLIDVSMSPPKQAKQGDPINWEICVLCQSDNGDVLQCPAKSTKAAIGSGYKSLAGQMPVELDINRLDEGNGREATLIAHRACSRNLAV